MEKTREPYMPSPPSGWREEMIEMVLEGRFEDHLSYREIASSLWDLFKEEQGLELEGLTVAWIAYVCWRYQKEYGYVTF
jgi:hypothetical protein